MMKKVLLITAALILAISCSGSPTDPNDTGDGGLIDEGSGITDPNQISAFLNNHQGRYYSESSENGITSRYIDYRIEGSKIYEEKSTTEMQGSKTLSGNKLQVEIIGNPSASSDYERNSYMTIFNFSDSSIKVFQKLIFSKDNFSGISGYQIIGTFNGLKKYAGNYYQYQSSSGVIEKAYFFTIDSSGNIYFAQDMVNQIKCSVNGDELTLDFTGGAYKCIFQENRAIVSIFENGTEQSVTSKKSDLLTPYVGTYSYNNNEITLTVSEADAVITSTTITLNNPTAILNGSNLIIYAHTYDNSTLKVEEHKITFSEDKTTADYTKPDGSKVTLTKN